MSLSPGTHLGPYEIVAPLGAGGMGEVYRARDPRLGREVAVKVLPAALSSDPDRLHRLEQEARAAAALNHPAILAVHDIGTSDNAPYIVTELLEGETLREKIAAGALSARKALDYALQIARGLAAAHEKGIVHRDLKPENVFVTTDERVKILDFGLAKLTQPESAPAGISVLPTGAAAAGPNTIPGLVMGTVGYMSPEQVRGVASDHRTDVFALGAILYEMLAGRRAFRGDTSMDTLSAILKEDPPDLGASGHYIPGLQRIVSRCVEKNPAARFQSTRDLAFALEGLSTASDSSAAAVDEEVARRRAPFATMHLRERVFATLAVAFLFTTLGLTAWIMRPAPTPAMTTFLVAAPEGLAMAAFALSPDGRRLAFVASSNSQSAFGAPARGKPSMVYVRPLDTVSAIPLAGTEGARNPFWSPDGRAIGFFADNKLKVIDAGGGSVRTICDAVGARTWGDWNSDGTIVFSTEQTNPIQRVSADGGRPTPVTTVRGRNGHLRPTFLPDGRHFLYYATPYLGSREAGAELHRAALDSPEDTVVLKPSGWARYAPPGYLVYVRGSDVVAQPFDAANGTLSGRAFTLGSAGNAFNSGANIADSGFSVGGAEALAFRTIEAAADNELVWFDRSGKRLSGLGAVGRYRNPELSPDGSRLAVVQTDPAGRSDVWVVDLARGVTTRLTLDASNVHNLPLWTPGGSSLVVRESAGQGLVEWPVGRTGAERQFSTTAFDPNSYSQDGRYIAYTILNPETNRDIGVMPLVGDRKPFLLVHSIANEFHGQVSPNGRWIAYTSDESSVDEIYIQKFPEGGQKTRVSTAGGDQARWRRDGRELFYLSADDELISLAVETTSELTVGSPMALFEVRNVPRGALGTNANYDVSTDGRRFIIASGVSNMANPPVTVMLNWQTMLR